MALYKLCLGFVLYTLQRICTMVDTATFVSIRELLSNQQLINFSSDTTGYEFYKRASLDVYDQEHRRVYIKSPPDNWAGVLRQIYDMEKDGDDFKLTYGNTSRHIYSNNHVVGTVILQMPEDETQRNRLEEYFNQFCDFFGSNSNQHVTRAGGPAPIRF